MRTRQKILLFLLILSKAVMGQYSLMLQVIGASGNEVSVGNISVSSTTGEAAISTLSNNVQLFTQGFHQDAPVLLSVKILEPGISGLSVFPNPSAGVLTIRSEKGFERPGVLQIIDASGKTCAEQPLVQGNGSQLLNLTAFPAGAYWLRVQDATGQAFFQVIKER